MFGTITGFHLRGLLILSCRGANWSNRSFARGVADGPNGLSQRIHYQLREEHPQSGMALGATQGDENRLGERFLLSPVSESRPGAPMSCCVTNFQGRSFAALRMTSYVFYLLTRDAAVTLPSRQATSPWCPRRSRRAGYTCDTTSHGPRRNRPGRRDRAAEVSAAWRFERGARRRARPDQWPS